MKKKKSQQPGGGIVGNIWPMKSELLSLILLLIALPLVYSKNTLDPVIMPRLFFLSLSLILILLLNFKHGKTTVNKWFVFSYGLYLVLVVLSVFQAVNVKEALVDIVKTSMLFFTLIYLTQTFQKEQVISSIPAMVNVAATISIFLGLSSYLGSLNNSDSIYMPDGRPWYYSVSGLMAHKNQYAISLMLMLPFTGYGIFRYKNVGRIYAVITTTAILFMIVFLRTRSVWVGTSLGLFIFFGGIIIFNLKLGIKKAHFKRLILTFSAISVLAIILIFAGKGGDYSISTLVKSISDPYSATNINRIKIWEVTGDMIAEKPVFGVGAGNWKLNTHRYFSATHFDKSLLNWLRPHNDYLWIWAEKGIFGLLAFISIFLVSMIFILKIIFSDAKTDNKILALLLASGIGGYLLVSFFTFPLERINHQVYLVIFFAVISAMFSNAKHKRDITVKQKFILIPALAIAIFAACYSYNLIRMENQVRECRDLQFSKNWKGMYDKSLQISTTFRDIDADGTPLGWYAGLSSMKAGRYERAVKAYEMAVDEHPGHFKSMNNLGMCYLKSKNHRYAISILKRATEILPDYPEGKTNLATAYLRNGQFHECYKTLASIPEYLIVDRILEFKHRIRGNPRLIGRQNMDSTLITFSGNPVDKYAYYIQIDPDWLALVEGKAKAQNIPLENAIQADAHFIANEKEPENYLFWNGLDYYEELILKDTAWVKHVQKQARQKGNDFRLELEGHARSEFASMNPVAYVLFVRAEKKKRQLLADTPRHLELIRYANTNKFNFETYLDAYVHYIVGTEYFEKSEYNRKIDGYIHAINQDDDWLSLVNQKARKKETMLSEELISEATYMVMREENGH